MTAAGEYYENAYEDAIIETSCFNESRFIFHWFNINFYDSTLHEAALVMKHH